MAVLGGIWRSQFESLEKSMDIIKKKVCGSGCDLIKRDEGVGFFKNDEREGKGLFLTFLDLQYFLFFA